MSYEKQTWVNNVSDVDEEKMNHIEDGIYQNSVDITNLKNRNVITAGLDSNVTISTAGENKITLNRVKTQTSSGFTISDGKVYVGQGISYVLVTGTIYVNRGSGAGTACNSLVKKNGSTITASTNTVPAGQSNHTVTAPLRVEPVSQGDYFELFYYGYSGDLVSSYLGTSLTIIAVK